MIVNVLLDLSSYSVNLLVDSDKYRLNGRLRGSFCSLKAVVFHVVQAQQIIQALDQRLQGDDLIGRWHPRGGAVHLAVPRNQSRIGLIGFSTDQFGFDRRRHEDDEYAT